MSSIKIEPDTAVGNANRRRYHGAGLRMMWVWQRNPRVREMSAL